MLFGDAKKWAPTKWRPIYTHIIRLYWQGDDHVTIAKTLGCSSALVGDVVNSDYGQHILGQFEAKTYDSTLECITLAQAAAAEILVEKINDALHHPDARIRARAQTEVLGIAGHTPVHRVSIERPDPILDAYKDATPQKLREELLRLKTSGPDDVRGPDGNLVN